VKVRASFRSQLVSGSVLWTLGLLVFISMFAIHLLATNPRPHQFIYQWFFNAPVIVVLAVAAAAMVGGAWQIRRSLNAMAQLHGRLTAVHRGEDREVTGRYPSEVQPLVDDLNALLVEREQRVQRALAKAGDLAHGLKTPLAVLAHDAERVASSGDHELAASMAAQVERVRRQIDYHLAHARAAAAGSLPGTRSLVAPSVDGLFRTLGRLHAERSIALRSAVASGHAVRCQREDLDEMLGNVLDNACKWGRSRVEVESGAVGSSIVITVDDDGPGIDPGMAAEVLKRGVRADERVEGTGLGLAIVRDLAEIYGGSIELSRAPLGGLRARLQLPASD
jgi:signal transduction histidine kinase